MNKVISSVDKAVADIPSGASVAIQGFFSAGVPVPLIEALARQGARDLTIISMQMGSGNESIIQLVLNKQIKKAICAYPLYRSATRGASSPFETAVRAGEIEMEVYPMGTFAEKLRAGGAGIPGFYTPAGVGTAVEEGKEKKRFGEKEFLLELALKPDFALVYAHKGDPLGNLVCRKTARNFGPEMAAAAKITIAAVEDIFRPGELDPDQIHIPGIYVQRVVKVERPRFIPAVN